MGKNVVLNNKSIFAIAFTLLNTNNLIALELGAVASISAEHTDNSLRTDINKRSDLEKNLQAQLVLQENTRTIQADIDYDINHIDYDKNTQEDETLINGLAQLTWSPLPQTFQWDFVNAIRNLQRDRRQAEITDNQEKRNIFTTGPVATIRLGKVDNLRLSAKYTTTEFDESENSDNNRAIADVGWIHRLSVTNNISAGFQYSEVEFDNPNQADIENTIAYAAYQSTLANTSLTVKLGHNTSERGNTGSVDAVFFEGALGYRDPSHDVSIVAFNLITDSTIGLGNNSTAIDESVVINDSNFNNPDIVERTFATLRYSYLTSCDTCTLSFSLSFDDQDFQQLLLDEESYEFSILAGYRSSTRLNTQLQYSQQNITFIDDGNREDKIETLRLTTTYNTTNSFRIFTFVSYQERSGDNLNVIYEELRGGVGLAYTFR